MGFLSEVLRENAVAVRDPRYLAGLPPRGPPTRPSLRQAIENGREAGSILVEYKRVSPGQVDPTLPARTVSQFVRETAQPSVVGYSCLATGPRFHGAPHDVLDLTRFSRRPVLFKDFVVEERQLDAAERSGASAVLLIARLATEGYLERSLADLALAAHRRGLEVLLEFHAEAELSQAEGVAADVFGVNVRDLDSLVLERAVAAVTLKQAHDAGLRPLLGLSGVEGPAEADQFWAAGADGILVGTAVARSPRPAELIASLRRPDHRGPG